jgi:SAM-dependent methyltransferase
MELAAGLDEGPCSALAASTCAETWEGPRGWGTPIYEHVLHEAPIGPGTTVLDCGCGAGRFVGLATQRGASAAGIDASAELAEIAAARTPAADIRTGDIEALPWPDKTFDAVTGFSTFQFADDHAAALTEARRVCRGQLWVANPTRLAESGIPQLFAALATLLPPESLSSSRSDLADLTENAPLAPTSSTPRHHSQAPRPHRRCQRTSGSGDLAREHLPLTSKEVGPPLYQGRLT